MKYTKKLMKLYAGYSLLLASCMLNGMGEQQTPQKKYEIKEEIELIKEESKVSSITASSSSASSDRAQEIDPQNKLQPDSQTKFPLHWAAANGCDQYVMLLIYKGHKNPNAIDTHRRTPLHYAAANGHTNIVSFLLNNLQRSRGGKYRVRDSSPLDDNNVTPAYYALYYQHDEIIRIIAEAERSRNSRATEQKQTSFPQSLLNGLQARNIELLEHKEEIQRAQNLHSPASGQPRLNVIIPASLLTASHPVTTQNVEQATILAFLATLNQEHKEAAQPEDNVVLDTPASNDNQVQSISAPTAAPASEATQQEPVIITALPSTISHPMPVTAQNVQPETLNQEHNDNVIINVPEPNEDQGKPRSAPITAPSSDETHYQERMEATLNQEHNVVFDVPAPNNNQVQRIGDHHQRRSSCCYGCLVAASYLFALSAVGTTVGLIVSGGSF